jgi:hypothetical protein
MKRPSTLDVATVLRQKRLFESELNKKNISNWDEDDWSEWKSITGQGPHYERPVKKEYYKRKPCSHTRKVLRVVDGHVFNSISECRRKEAFSKTKMDALILKGEKYKTTQ